jgi:hypothetical protein
MNLWQLLLIGFFSFQFLGILIGHLFGEKLLDEWLDEKDGEE